MCYSNFLKFQIYPHGHAKIAGDMYHDYTHGRSILVNGIPFDLMTMPAAEANIQPFSNVEELGEAARIASIRSDELEHSGMPPFITRDGSSHRIRI